MLYLWFLFGLLCGILVLFTEWYLGNDIVLRDLFLLIIFTVGGFGTVLFISMVLIINFIITFYADDDNNITIFKGRK